YLGPRIRRKPVPVPGLPKRIIGDVAVDEGQHFPVALDPQHPGRAVEPGRLQMALILMHRGRPRAYRPQQPVPAPPPPSRPPPAQTGPPGFTRVPATGHDVSIPATVVPPADPKIGELAGARQHPAERSGAGWVAVLVRRCVRG